MARAPKPKAKVGHNSSPPPLAELESRLAAIHIDEVGSDADRLARTIERGELLFHGIAHDIRGDDHKKWALKFGIKKAAYNRSMQLAATKPLIAKARAWGLEQGGGKDGDKPLLRRDDYAVMKMISVCRAWTKAHPDDAIALCEQSIAPDRARDIVQAYIKYEPEQQQQQQAGEGASAGPDEDDENEIEIARLHQIINVTVELVDAAAQRLRNRDIDPRAVLGRLMDVGLDFDPDEEGPGGNASAHAHSYACSRQ